MQDRSVSKPEMKKMKPLTQSTVTKFEEHNEFGQKGPLDVVSESQIQTNLPQTAYADQFQEHSEIRKKEADGNVLKFKLPKTTHADQFQEHSEIRKKEADGNVSKFKVPKTTHADKFQEHSEIRTKKADGNVLKFKVPKTTHADQFQEHSEIRNKEADGNVSKFKVPKKKLLAPTTSAFHFQQELDADVSKFMATKRKQLSTTSVAEFKKHNNIGERSEVHGDVSELNVLEKGLMAQSSSLNKFQAHSENGHQEAQGGISKFKVPKMNLLSGTSVFQFQENCEIGQPKAHEDVLMSKMEKDKLFTQTTSVAQLQAHGEIGQEETLKMPKISKKRKKSSGSPSNGCPDDSPLTKSANKYRALRHKFLMLEEESSNLEDGLKWSDSEMKKLEEEKLALLDKLVVLEGLVDPSSFKSSRKKL